MQPDQPGHPDSPDDDPRAGDLLGGAQRDGVRPGPGLEGAPEGPASILLPFIAFIILLFSTEVAARSEFETIKKSISANVIFLRHALAPGFGDPDNFNKGDCSTQRNLNNKGRLQARAIGDYLKKSNLRFSEILTSEWCRCIDTAKELNLGQWETFSGLNSFFQGYEFLLGEPD